MNDTTKTFREAKKLIEDSQKILLLCHRRPDGDTLGAGCAFHVALENMGKQTTLGCVDTPTERFAFLPGIRRFVKEFDFHDYDLIIVSDAGAHYMTQYHAIYPEIFSGKDVPVINIDHHTSNDNFGTLNIVDPQAASATMIIYYLFRFMNIAMTPSIATCLLAGLYNDTGSFMHSNTTEEVMNVAADLVKKGGKVFPIAKHMFRTASLGSLKLWGRALENLKVNDEGVAISVLTDADFRDTGAESDDSSGVIDLLNSVPGAKFSLLLCEDGKGSVKGSLRTQRNDVDLAELAGTFGGGGHKKAAGFTVPGKVEREVSWRIVSDKGQEIPLKLTV
jgi:phosphoesterase RecJ-like protein